MPRTAIATNLWLRTHQVGAELRAVVEKCPTLQAVFNAWRSGRLSRRDAFEKAIVDLHHENVVLREEVLSLMGIGDADVTNRN